MNKKTKKRIHPKHIVVICILLNFQFIEMCQLQKLDILISCLYLLILVKISTFIKNLIFFVHLRYPFVLFD